MKKSFELYLLDGCSRCVKIKYKLIGEEIDFDHVDCTSSENTKCDSVEDKYGCSKYPIAIVKNKGVTHVIHFCESVKSGGTTTKKIYADSEDMFVAEVKKALY